jgi:WD40 repeat protein
LAQFTPTGDRFLTYDGGTSIRVWNLQGQQQAVIHGRWPLNFSPTPFDQTNDNYTPALESNGNLISSNGNYTITLGANGNPRFWNLNGKSSVVFQAPSDEGEEKFDPRFGLFSISFNDDLVAVADTDTILLWNLQGKLLKTIQIKGFNRIAQIHLTSDSQRLITFHPSSRIRILDLQGHELASFQRIEASDASGWARTSNFSNTVVSPKGDRFLTLANESAILWDITGKGIALLRGEQISDNPRSILNLRFSDDGERIITSTSSTTRVWDIQGRLIAEYSGYAAALSPDGKQIVLVSNETNIPTLWQVDDVDGLLKRSCEWLRFSIAFRQNHQNREICDNFL